MDSPTTGAPAPLCNGADAAVILFHAASLDETESEEKREQSSAERVVPSPHNHGIVEGGVPPPTIIVPGTTYANVEGTAALLDTLSLTRGVVRIPLHVIPNTDVPDTGEAYEGRDTPLPMSEEGRGGTETVKEMFIPEGEEGLHHTADPSQEATMQMGEDDDEPLSLSVSVHVVCSYTAQNSSTPPPLPGPTSSSLPERMPSTTLHTTDSGREQTLPSVTSGEGTSWSVLSGSKDRRIPSEEESGTVRRGSGMGEKEERKRKREKEITRDEQNMTKDGHTGRWKPPSQGCEAKTEEERASSMESTSLASSFHHVVSPRSTMERSHSGPNPSSPSPTPLPSISPTPLPASPDTTTSLSPRPCDTASTTPASGSGSSASVFFPSLSLLLHVLAALRDRHAPATPPPLSFAIASPFLRVLCECYTPTGYRWGRVRVQRSPTVDGAVAVDVPGDAELRAISWWLSRDMKEAELDHYYGRLWGRGEGVAFGSRLPAGTRGGTEEDDTVGHVEGYRWGGGGWGRREGGDLREGSARPSFHPTATTSSHTPSSGSTSFFPEVLQDERGSGLTSCVWPSPSPMGGGGRGDGVGMEYAFGGGGRHGGGGGGLESVGAGLPRRSFMGSTFFSSYVHSGSAYQYHPYYASGMLPSEGGGVNGSEDAAADGEGAVFSSYGWLPSSPAPESSGGIPSREGEGGATERTRQRDGATSEGEEAVNRGDEGGEGWRRGTAEGRGRGRAVTSGSIPKTPSPKRLPSLRRPVSPATARRLRQQRTREAYPSRMVQLTCIGHERAKAMLAASSLSMMRSLRISKIELSLDYPPMLHLLGNTIWDRYTQLSTLELLATNCLGVAPSPSPVLGESGGMRRGRLTTAVSSPVRGEEERSGRKPAEKDDTLQRSVGVRETATSTPSLRFPTTLPSVLTAIPPLSPPTDGLPGPSTLLAETSAEKVLEEAGGEESHALAPTSFLYPADGEPLGACSSWMFPSAVSPSSRVPAAHGSASMSTPSLPSSSPTNPSRCTPLRGDAALTGFLSKTAMASQRVEGVKGTSPLLQASLTPSSMRWAAANSLASAKGNGGALRGLEFLPLLRELNLSNSLIDGIGFMGKSKTLQKLNLSNTSISNPGLQGLQECMSLKVLILFQCPSITSVKCLTPLYYSPANDRERSSRTRTTSTGRGGSHGSQSSQTSHPSSTSSSNSTSASRRPYFGPYGKEGRVGSHGDAGGAGDSSLAIPSPMNLEVLDLRGTSVNTQGLMGLGLLPRLRSLRLGRTKVTHLRPALAHAPALTHLDLEHCTTLHPEEGLEGMFVGAGEGGGRPTPIQYLNLTRANVSSLAALARARTLRCLIASRVVSLAGRRLPEMFLTDSFGGSCLWSLSHLDLSHSPLDATQCMEVLVQCVNLQYVNLTRTQNLTSVDGLEQLQYLREVHLSHTAITSVNCFGRGRAPCLTHLNASHTSLEDDGIRWLSFAPRLSLLDLTDTQVCHVGHLHACASLKVLILSSTLVSSNGLRGLEQSRTLEELYLNEALVKHFTTWDVEASAICPLSYSTPSWMKRKNTTTIKEDVPREAEEEDHGKEQEKDMEKRFLHGKGLHVRPSSTMAAEGDATQEGGLSPHPTPSDSEEDEETDEEEEEEESPALVDARREAQLRQLWSVVEKVARKYKTLRAAVTPPFTSSFSSSSLSSGGLPSSSVLGSGTMKTSHASFRRHTLGEEKGGEGDGGSSSIAPRSPVLEVGQEGCVAPLLLPESTALRGFLSQLRGWMWSRLLVTRDEEAAASEEGIESWTAHANAGRDSPVAALDCSIREEEIARWRTSEENQRRGEGSREEIGRRGTQEGMPDSVPLSGPQGSTSRWRSRARVHKRTQNKTKSSHTPLPPCSTVFYPSLWKLSVAHTRHRSSGLIGILQLPRLVELDVSDTWMDSPLGVLFPFSTAVEDCLAMTLLEWKREEGGQGPCTSGSGRLVCRSRPLREEERSSSPPTEEKAKDISTSMLCGVEEAQAAIMEVRMTVKPVLRCSIQKTVGVRSDPEWGRFLQQRAPLLLEVLQWSNIYPQCFSFLLHQRLRCLVLCDAKLQHAQFLYGVEYAQVLEYISVQSCQPSLSLMLDPSSLASLGACSSLSTLNMADTDITSRDVWFLQKPNAGTFSSPSTPTATTSTTTRRRGKPPQGKPRTKSPFYTAAHGPRNGKPTRTTSPSVARGTSNGRASSSSTSSTSSSSLYENALPASRSSPPLSGHHRTTSDGRGMRERSQEEERLAKSHPERQEGTTHKLHREEGGRRRKGRHRLRTSPGGTQEREGPEPKPCMTGTSSEKSETDAARGNAFRRRRREIQTDPSSPLQRTPSHGGGRRPYHSARLSLLSTSPSGIPSGKPPDENEDGLESSALLTSSSENSSLSPPATGSPPSPPSLTKTTTSIVSLNLSGTILTDLRFLCFHRLVRVLRLSATIVRDLSPLQYCRDLHLLDVSKTRVLDLRPVSSCLSLRYLFAADTFTTQVGIQQLPSLCHLEVLDLSGTPITSILLLRPLTHLTHLRIRNTAVPRAESKCFPPGTLIQQ